MTSPDSLDPELFQHIFGRTASASFFDQLCREHHLRVRRGIYSVAMVLWLMMLQRLNGKRTLSSAVHWLVRHAGVLSPEAACKRMREDRISTRTGGYCQARQKLPTLVVMQAAEHIFQHLQLQMRAEAPDIRQPVFVVDGTTLRAPHEKDLVKAFPPGRNQHGDNHWPVLRTVVFHDAHTGLASRPSWGPMYGPQAVSEQHLAQEALSGLPADAVVMGDGNFGIFAFAYDVRQSGRAALLRLTQARAQKVLGDRRVRPGRRYPVAWEASAAERKKYPDLPPGASLKGWVVACWNPSDKKELLYFFTTLDLKPKRVLALYKLRWNIETDLRSLKRTVQLHEVTSRSKAMVEKDILMAVSAYNVVRAVMYLAACRARRSPRELSFSTAQDAVLAAWPHLQGAPDDATYRSEMERLIRIVAQATLPRRTRRRSYERKIWGRGGHFPYRGTNHPEEVGQ